MAFTLWRSTARTPLRRHFANILLLSILLIACADAAPSMLHDFNSIDATALEYDTTTNSTSPDVDGTAPIHRSSAGLLLWAIESLVLGTYLSFFGKRGWKASTALGLGLTLELVVWVVVVNSIGPDGFSSRSSAHTAVIIWAVVTAGGLIGAALGWWIWMVGMYALAACGGFALALSIVMMGNNDLPEVARWIIVAVCTTVGLIVGPLFQRHVGMALTSSISGSFLFFLGIDLFINEDRGMSLGLRYLLDRNSAHATALSTYEPPVSTRVLLVLIWCFSAILTIGQTYVWRKAPFIRTFHSLSEHHVRHMDFTDATSPSPDNDMSSPLTEYNNRSVKSRLQRRYENASPTTIDDSKSTLRSPVEMSSPDTPPSRPNSVVSTNYAMRLRSRPPTFANMPLTTPPIPPLLPTNPDPRDSLATTGQSFDIPVVAVPPNLIPRDQLTDKPSTEIASGTFPRTPTISIHSSKSSKDSRKSWRKPVPAVEVDSSETGTAVPSTSGMISRGFDQGLLSGREVSIARTDSTPSSGAQSSNIMDAGFGKAVVEGDLSGSGNASTGLRRGIPSPSNIRVVSPLAQPQSPTLVSPTAASLGRPSVDVDSESFYTMSEGHTETVGPGMSTEEWVTAPATMHGGGEGGMEEVK